MEIKNFTPHQITEINTNTTFETQGVARVSVGSTPVGKINGIQISVPEYGEVVNLPEEKKDTYYIVSQMVAAALPDRLDLLYPGELVRDEKGLPVGCKGFRRTNLAIFTN